MERLAARTISFGLVAIVAAMLVCSGCSSTKSEAVARPALATYSRVALWPKLTRRQEELFVPLYMKAFPTHSVIERRDLSAVLDEQDLLPTRLSEEKRAKLREIYGVQAIVFPNYNTEDGTQLALKVIDTDTGEITAALVVRPNATWFDSNITEDDLIRRSIDLLSDEVSRSVSATLRERRLAESGDSN